MRLLPLALALVFAGAQADAAVRRAHVAAAPDTCARTAEREAFDTEGLKSELMVTALACKEQDKYNGFMHAYLPAVAASEKDLNAYFKRVYGRQSQKEYDNYISNLANVQSEGSLHSGTAFCSEYDEMFDEVMSLHDSTELADYAHSQAILQPVALNTCTDKPAPVVAHKRRAAHKKA